MFIRNKTDKNKLGTRVQIAKSVRKGDKISQKIVRHVGTAGGSAQLNAEKIQQAQQWDGLHGIVVSGLEHLSVAELLAQYRQLWQIEHCFRTNKHDLKIRLIYHWTAKRIHAHLALCYMAFCCVQHLRHRLRLAGCALSVAAIHRELLVLQHSVLYKKGTQQKYILPSPITTIAKRIYRCLSLRWNERPFKVI